MLNQLSLKVKIFSLVGLFSAFCLIGALLLISRVSHVHKQDQVLIQRGEIADQARVVQVNFKKQVQAWKDILLRGSDPTSLQKYRTEFFHHESEVQKGAGLLAGQAPEVSDMARQFVTAHAQLGAEYRKALANFEASKGRDFSAADTYVKGKDRPVTDLIDKIVEQITARSAEMEKKSEAGIHRDAEMTLWLSIAGIAALMACGIYVGYIITHETAVLTDTIAARAEELSQGRGDLTQRIPVKSRDEFGRLAAAFNVYTDALQRIVTQLSKDSARLATASEEISSTAEQSAERSREQAQQTSQVATAMEEMSTTVIGISDHSQKASEAAKHASEAAGHGGRAVEESLAAIRSIANSTGNAAERVTELGKNSDQIGRIIEVIDDIADKTNLLALNAAIEAARAGEQGRGFAVVADEVRKLAEQTTNATKEIASMIQVIQRETSHAVEAMRNGQADVETGVEKASSAGAVLTEIIGKAAVVGEMITHIATASTQQSAATDEINQSVNKISDLTKASSAGAEMTAKACEDLSALAFDLAKLIAGFKVQDEQKAIPMDLQVFNYQPGVRAHAAGMH